MSLDDLPVMQPPGAGWKQHRGMSESLQGDVSLALQSPHGGRSALRLHAWAVNPQEVPVALEAWLDRAWDVELAHRLQLDHADSRDPGPALVAADRGRAFLADGELHGK